MYTNLVNHHVYQQLYADEHKANVSILMRGGVRYLILWGTLKNGYQNKYLFLSQSISIYVAFFLLYLTVYMALRIMWLPVVEVQNDDAYVLISCNKNHLIEN